jgi:hypothetical protein
MAKQVSQPTVVVTRTIEIVERTPLTNYEEMTAVQAQDYELRLPRVDKIAAFAEYLVNHDPSAIRLTETVVVTGQ